MDKFVVDETNIIGVLLWNGVQFEKKENGKLFWICAKHSSFAKPKEVPNQMVHEDEDEEEPNTEDEDFIDDEEESDGEQSEESSAEEENNEFKDICQGLKRQTPNDKMNQSKYMEEQSKYQLEIHTETNPGLHLSPEKRLKR